jgi:hypothetical protein
MRLGSEPQSLEFTIELEERPILILKDERTSHIILVVAKGARQQLKLLDQKGNLLSSKFLPDHDSITTLKTWLVKKRTYICVGTKTQLGGRLIVYNIKSSAKANEDHIYKFNSMSELEFPDPIISIAPMGFYLILCAGDHLYQIKISAETRKIMIGCKSVSRAPAISIKTTNDYEIFAATKNDSICVFKLDREQKKIKYQGSDDFPRDALDCWILSEDQELNAETLLLATFESGAAAVYSINSRNRVTPISSVQLLAMPLKIIPNMMNMRDSVYMVSDDGLDIKYLDFTLPISQDVASLVIVTLVNERTNLAKISSQMALFLLDLQSRLISSPKNEFVQQVNESEFGESKGFIDITFLLHFTLLDKEEQKSISSSLSNPIPFTEGAYVSPGELSLKNHKITAFKIGIILNRLNRAL